MDDRLPFVLTVEEAGEVLRIGRTKAYAMAREWRDTGGRSGLPVIDLGHVLRVPRRALEDLLCAELNTPLTNRGSPNGDRHTSDVFLADNGEGEDGQRDRVLPHTSRTRTRPTRSEDQLGFYAARPPTS